MTSFTRRASRLRWIWRVAAASLAVATVAWATRTVYVNTRYASLRNGKASTNAIVEKLSFGQPLEVVAEEGAFLRVKLANGKTGFIARNWTADKAPAADGLSASLGQAARSSTSGGVSYTAGARGLSTEALTFADSIGAGDAAEAVKHMEKSSADDAAVQAFLEDGKLGDWREVRP